MLYSLRALLVVVCVDKLSADLLLADVGKSIVIRCLALTVMVTLMS